MTQTVAERFAWYGLPETRSWKRRVQFFELVFIAAMVILSCIGFAISEGPKGFEAAFYMFAFGLLLSLSILGPFILNDQSVSRYVRSFLLLGLGCGAGCLAGFGFVILTSMARAA